MKSIYTYRDYRKALSDFYQKKKAESSSYSYASFSKKAKLASPNYLKLVMDGKRDLTVANIHSFASAVGLQGGEVEFFEALVLENQADGSNEKKYYTHKLAKLKTANPQATVRKKTSTALEQRLMPAVLLCASGKALDDAIAFAMSELRMDRIQVKTILDELLETGDLRYDENGILRFSARHEITSDPLGVNDRQKRFLKEGLNEAQSVFDSRYAKGLAKFMSVLMTAPEKSLADLFIQLRDSVEKATEDFDPPPGESYGIYRVQMQVYRLNKSEE